jgi:hypothetical protein
LSLDGGNSNRCLRRGVWYKSCGRCLNWDGGR